MRVTRSRPARADFVMKVVILGGSGVFGSRLARLLRRDGHTVCLAARRAATALAAEIGADCMVFDRADDPAALFEGAPDVLVDAAGPFQAYGDDPYRLARAAIAAGVNYIDLSDDADFTTGISDLDAEARARGVYVLSGVSSVPAISAAAVHALRGGMERTLGIDAAILPGNRAPRGLSVMAGILAQVGRPLRLWQGGAWVTARGWSDPVDYELPGGEIRRAYLNRVPDLECFPHHFDAKSVSFRAGLELSVMGRALAVLSWVRQFVDLPVPLGLAHWGASCLEPFGTDRGGMIVSVTGQTAQGVVTRNWRLLAQAGEGPFVPAVPARALLRAGGAAPGARAALDDIPLTAIEAAMDDLAISFERDETEAHALVQEAIGAGFEDLPAPVRASHAVHPVLRLTGTAKVTRGDGFWPKLLARVFGFPAAGADIPLTVIKTRRGLSECWERHFAEQRFASVLRATPHGITERFGPFTFRLGLHVSEGALHFPVLAGWIGPLRLPRFVLPQSETREYANGGQMQFDVTLRAPITGQFIIRYEGTLEPVA